MELVIAGYLSLYNFEESYRSFWWIILLLWIFFLLATSVGGKGFCVRKKLLYPGFVMVVFTFITSIYNINIASDSYAMLKEVVLVVGYTMTVLSTIRSKEELYYVWHGLFLGGVIAGIYQIAQIDWSSFYSETVLINLRYSISSRVFVNTFAFQQFISFMAGIYLLTKNFKTQNKKNSFLYTIGSALLVVSMVFTGSRKVLMGMVVFLVVSLCFGKRYFWRIAIIAIVVMFGINLLLSNATLYNVIGWRMESILTNSDDASSQEREQIMHDALVTGLTHPFGVGLDGSKYYSTGRKVYAHNNYLEIFADFGIVGFLAYYGFYIYMFSMLIKTRKNSVAWEWNIMLAAFISWLMIEFAQIVYYNFAYYMLLLTIEHYLYYEKSKPERILTDENRNSNSI